MMETTGFIIGVISLAIAIWTEVHAARVRHALASELSQIKAANQLILAQANLSDVNSLRRLYAIQGIAECQKTMINGLTRVLKLPFWDLWEKTVDTLEA